MAEEKEEPEHIKKYEKLKEHKDGILEATRRHHIEAFYHAVDNILKEEGSPRPNYKKLKESKTQLEFADKMADFYFDKAKDYFRIKEGDEKLGDLEKDMLLKAYTGATKHALRKQVSTFKDKYRITTHHKIADDLLEETQKELTSASQYHLKDEKKSLLEFSGADKFLNPELVDLDEAIKVYDQFKQTGVITEKILENMGFEKNKFKKKSA